MSEIGMRETHERLEHDKAARKAVEEKEEAKGCHKCNKIKNVYFMLVDDSFHIYRWCRDCAFKYTE